MKVIDLLNKIANGEDLPKHILFDNTDYFLEEKSEIQCFIEECIGTGTLNDEIEIIEEPKKIERLAKNITDNACATIDQRKIANKINEIIDYINKGENNEK